MNALSEQRQMLYKRNFYLSFLSALFISLSFTRYMLTTDFQDGLLQKLQTSNLSLYLVLLFIFGISFLTICGLCKLYAEKGQLPGRIWNEKLVFTQKVSKTAAVAFISIIVIFFAKWLYADQFKEFGISRTAPVIEEWCPAIFYSFCIGVALYIYSLWRSKSDIQTWMLYSVYALCVIFTFYGLYHNLYLSDLHHGTAFTESIYNFLDLIPVSIETTGVYGHYGLFFLLPLKLFGGKYEALASLIALAGCIAMLLTVYVIHKLIKMNWLRAILSCASIIPVVVLRRSNYWQVQPLRVLFPSIFIAYAVYLQSEERVTIPSTRREIFVGWFLSVLAILWNTETGIFCAIGFVAFAVSKKWMDHKPFSKPMWSSYLAGMIFVVFSVLGAVGIVNLYNLLCKGHLIFRVFFFPLFDKRYMSDVLQYSPLWGNHSWVYVLILFLLTLCMGIYHTQWFQINPGENCSIAPISVMIGVIGLLNFSYYFNRAAWCNLDICFPLAVCANATLLYSGKSLINDWRHEQIHLHTVVKTSLVSVSLITCAFLASYIVLAPKVLEKKYQQSNPALVQMAAEQIIDSGLIPQNTYGLGMGIAPLWHELGWENYGHWKDIPDLWVGSNSMATVQLIVDELESQNACVVRIKDEATILQAMQYWGLEVNPEEHFTLKATIQTVCGEFCYYERRDEK